jgi:hypothetical protein
MNACVMMSWIGFLVKGKYKVSGFQTLEDTGGTLAH